MLWMLTLLPVLLLPWAFGGPKAVFLQLIEGCCSKRSLVFKSRKGTAPNTVKFSSNASAESQLINFQVAQAIFHADANSRIVNCTALYFYQGTAARPGTPQTKADLVLSKQAVFHRGMYILFQVKSSHQVDLSGLLPAVHQAVADDDLVARTGRRSFRIKSILARSLAPFESSSIVRQRPGPKCAIFDQDVAV